MGLKRMFHEGKFASELDRNLNIFFLLALSFPMESLVRPDHRRSYRGSPPLGILLALFHPEKGKVSYAEKHRQHQ